MREVKMWETRDGRLFYFECDAIKHDAELLGIEPDDVRRLVQLEEMAFYKACIFNTSGTKQNARDWEEAEQQLVEARLRLGLAANESITHVERVERKAA